MNQYERGTKIGLRAEFKRAPGIPADPTTIKLRILPPGGGPDDDTAHEYSVDELVIREDVGIYRYALTPQEAGLWRYRWEGTGDVEAAAEGGFMVRLSAFD